MAKNAAHRKSCIKYDHRSGTNMILHKKYKIV